MNIVHDLFPARLALLADGVPVPDLDTVTYLSVRQIKGSRSVEALRIVLTDTTIMVAADSSSGPVLIFQERYDRATLKLAKGGKAESYLTTITGKFIVFGKDESSCSGCGSRLRTWNPYRTMNSSKDPTE